MAATITGFIPDQIAERLALDSGEDGGARGLASSLGSITLREAAECRPSGATD